jgi:hypothetical protein
VYIWNSKVQVQDFEEPDTLRKQPPQKLALLLADKCLMRSLVWKDLE